MSSFTGSEFDLIFPPHPMEEQQAAAWGNANSDYLGSNNHPSILPNGFVPSHYQWASTSSRTTAATAALGQAASNQQYTINQGDYVLVLGAQDTQGNNQWTAPQAYENSAPIAFAPIQHQEFQHQTQYLSTMTGPVTADASRGMEHPQQVSQEAARIPKRYVAQQSHTAHRAVVYHRRSSRCRCPYCSDASQESGGARKRPFPCTVSGCDKVYGKSSHLKSHMRWHMGERPYACGHEDCTRAFTRSDELLRHSRTHTGEKRFACSQCDKKFMRSDHLHKHEKTHENRRQRLIAAMREEYQETNAGPSEGQPDRRPQQDAQGLQPIDLSSIQISILPEYTLQFNTGANARQV